MNEDEAAEKLMLAILDYLTVVRGAQVPGQPDGVNGIQNAVWERAFYAVYDIGHET